MASTLHNLQTSVTQRLHDAMGATARVLSAFDLDEAKQSQVIAPAVFVSFEGAQITEYSESRKAAIILVNFNVIAVARQASRMTRADAAAGSALELLESVVIALTGFKPTGAIKPMKMLSAEPPAYEPPIAWLPTSWAVEAMLPTTTA